MIDLKARGVGLLRQWLDSINVPDITKLTDDERIAYESYRDIFNEELTLDDLSIFLKDENEKLHELLRTAVLEGKERNAILLSARIENYKVMVDYIENPKEAKEKLIEELKSTINLNK